MEGKDFFLFFFSLAANNAGVSESAAAATTAAATATAEAAAAVKNGLTANIELLSHHTAIANMGPARGRQVVLKTNSQSGSETVALNSGEV